MQTWEAAGSWWWRRLRQLGPMRGVGAAAAAVLPAGQRDGTDTGDRVGPCRAEHGGRRLDAVLAGTPHPVRDEPGHDGAGERGAAPLRHAVEVADLAEVRDHVADVLAKCVGVDEVPARRVGVD